MFVGLRISLFLSLFFEFPVHTVHVEVHSRENTQTSHERIPSRARVGFLMHVYVFLMCMDPAKQVMT